MAHLLNLSSKPISRLLKSVVSKTSDSLPALFHSVSQTTPILVVSDGGAQLNAALRVLRLAGLSVMAVRSAGGTVDNLPDGIVQIDDSDGLAAVLEAAEDVLQASSATKPLRLQVLSSDPEACQVFCLSGKPVADVALRVLPVGAPNQIVAVREFQSGLYDVQVSDCSVPKGAILSNEEQPAELSDQFSVQVAWFGTEPLFSGRTYLFEQLGQAVSGTVTGIKFRVDSHSKTEHAAAGSLNQDEVGEVTINLERDIVFDPIDICPQLGRLIIRDPVDQKVLGVAAIRFALRRAQNVHKQALVIDRAARESLNGHKGRVVWFTGLSGSGKSTVANAVEQALHEQGTRTYILDGDNVRHGLNKDLGFTDADRVENIRRIAEVAKLMVDAGLVVLTAFISPFRSERDMARAMFADGEFVEVFVDVPLSVAEDRDPKGLYKKARRGELPNFTGIDSDYEAPESAEIVIRTDQGSVDECANRVLGFLN